MAEIFSAAEKFIFLLLACGKKPGKLYYILDNILGDRPRFNFDLYTKLTL